MTGSPRPRSRTTARRQTYPANRTNRTSRRRRLSWKGWLILTSSVVILCLFTWAALARRLAPRSNTSLTRFDAIIVLGSPATRHGNPTAMELSRVTEAVHEYERGVASHIIFTGGADRNRPVEARVMARTAEAQGIPASAIVEEGDARDTIQNGCYSTRIMQNRGWHSAEVISNSFHLPRAGLIFSRLPLEWRTHPAPPLEPEGRLHSSYLTALETLKTVRYLVWAREFERCQP